MITFEQFLKYKSYSSNFKFPSKWILAKNPKSRIFWAGGAGDRHVDVDRMLKNPYRQGRRGEGEEGEEGQGYRDIGGTGVRAIILISDISITLIHIAISSSRYSG